MDTSFKTCFLGGFDKKDVITFIEQQSKEYTERINGLVRDNEVLKEAVQRMETERNEMRPKAEQHDAARESADILQRRIEELTAQMKSLQQENEELRAFAEEYAGVKDHIAEIEISAHRRTEEFRAEAIAQLRDLINQQRSWCSEERGRYNCLNNELKQKLHQIEAVVAMNTDDGFERMMAGLQYLEDTLR